MCGGTHTVTITDSSNCITTADVTIVPAPLLDLNVTPYEATCDSANGSACVGVIGGVAPYGYLWQDDLGNTVSTTSCAAGLAGGVYTITVTDSTGCDTTAIANVNDEPVPAVSIVSITDVTCFGYSDGTATVSVDSGGAPPFTFSWDNGDTSATADSLAAGVHIVVVTDSNGCVASADTIIDQPSVIVAAVTFTLNPSCIGACNGEATVSVIGGTPPYIYQWDDLLFQTTQQADSLCAGNYIISVTDANGCPPGIDTATIVEPDSIVITANVIQNVGCKGDSSGMITVGVTPVVSYTYSWSPIPGTGPTLANLPAGTYTVTVINTSSCVSSESFTITEPAQVLALSDSSAPDTCGRNNGLAVVIPTGGIAPYSYLWDANANSQTTQTATGLAPGTYSVMVTDTNGCTNTISVTVGNIEGPKIDSIKVAEAISCNGGSNGILTVVASGGTPTYTYSWTPLGGTDDTALTLSQGQYIVTVTDDYGCSITGSIMLAEPQPAVITATGSDTICIGDSAQISAQVVDSTAVFGYTWSDTTLPGTGGPHWVSPDTTTTYTVSHINEFSCKSDTGYITVTVNPPLAVSPAPAVICEGDSVTISANVSGGNGGPYNYTWSNGATGSSITVSPNTDTTYSVTVSDNCSPDTVGSVLVSVAPTPIADFSADTVCLGNNTQFTDLSLNGSTYLWIFGDSLSGSADTSTLQNPTHIFTTTVPYDVTLIVGLGNCTDLITRPDVVTVYQNPVTTILDQDVINPSDEDECDGEATINPTTGTIGGTPPYTYQWVDTINGNIISNTNIATGLCESTYIITTTDANGCVTIDTLTLPVGCQIKCKDIFNGISPNNDGVNDYWWIEALQFESCKPNEVTLYNRWGDVVWKGINYNNIDDNNNDNNDDGVVWKGTNKNIDPLPDGTYFYLIKVEDKEKPCTGWIQIMR
ncbi:MAG: hypothetical protein FVQ77_17385 [Cytophagales bacterium]|nr:hypothetical protein [Cytophagales bacterium]